MNGSSCCVAKSAWFTSNKHSEKSLVPPFKDYRHSSLREKLQTHKFGLELAKYLLLRYFMAFEGPDSEYADM